MSRLRSDSATQNEPLLRHETQEANDRTLVVAMNCVAASSTWPAVGGQMRRGQRGHCCERRVALVDETQDPVGGRCKGHALRSESSSPRDAVDCRFGQAEHLALADARATAALGSGETCRL